MGEETAGTLSPEQLQQEILALDDRITKMAQLQQQMTEFLDKGLVEQISTAVTKTLSPVVDAIQKKFDEHEAFMKQLAQSKGGGSGIGDIIGKIIDKIPMGGSPASGVSELDRLILTETKQIQAISLRSVLNKVAKEAGITAPVDHVMILEPKPNP